MLAIIFTYKFLLIRLQFMHMFKLLVQTYIFSILKTFIGCTVCFYIMHYNDPEIYKKISIKFSLVLNKHEKTDPIAKLL